MNIVRLFKSFRSGYATYAVVRIDNVFASRSLFL